jgi:hypothetical protein
LRWLVVGNPSKLANDPELSPNVALVVAPERLEGFAEVTGIRLERLSAGAIAGYSLGNLYLAELEGAEAPEVRERFSARLAEGGVVHNRAGLQRIVGTNTKGSVQALVTVDDRLVAFAGGDATLARVVEAYAERRLRSPTALHGAGLRLLAPPAGDALLTFLAPGPFTNEWGGAAGGIVASTLAVSIEARKAPDGRLTATLMLAGDWSADGDKALHELERAWADLQASSTGHLLGLDKATPARGTANLQILTLSADLEAGPLARGLRDATSADVREILELDGAGPGTLP